MSAENLFTFEIPAPIVIPNAAMTGLTLVAREAGHEFVTVDGDRLRFTRRGWFEVLLTVQWDTTSAAGHRFAHTAIPDHHPLHSEAIDATVLNALSGGEQLLRGNTVFEPADGAATLRLQVWQDSGRPLEVRDAALALRELSVAPR